MSPADVFGIVVRTTGLIVTLYTLMTTVILPSIAGFGFSFLAMIAGFAVGLYLLRGAPFVMQFAYPDDAN